ncbi:hypothetical protein B0I32_102141 [Nonomuraea fuscirosea]|uniref:Uncharacterized protein n=1 Tax=Nonomuraea fuscirosea TaxID=1291556 RepID=A0A2T0N8J2_9ACTN|nr:hypothetical protein [Nonomuraea fuscirosea]PRX69085.1 hypothetical protein B0I32_102141 [Nonomuraea fuscirosea]
MSQTVGIDKRQHASSAKRAQGLDESTKVWNTINVSNSDEAAGWVNLEPAQGAGEAAFSSRSDGSVDVYYFM